MHFMETNFWKMDWLLRSMQYGATIYIMEKNYFLLVFNGLSMILFLSYLNSISHRAGYEARGSNGASDINEIFAPIIPCSRYADLRIGHRNQWVHVERRPFKVLMPLGNLSSTQSSTQPGFLSKPQYITLKSSSYTSQAKLLNCSHVLENVSKMGFWT